MDGVHWSDLGKYYDVNLPNALGTGFTAHQVPTYVVGINIEDRLIENPQVNPWVALNEVAQAGGVARPRMEAFYDAFDQPDLQAALNEIAARIECTVTLDGRQRLDGDRAARQCLRVAADREERRSGLPV